MLREEIENDKIEAWQRIKRILFCFKKESEGEENETKNKKVFGVGVGIYLAFSMVSNDVLAAGSGSKISAE